MRKKILWVLLLIAVVILGAIIWKETEQSRLGITILQGSIAFHPALQPANSDPKIQPGTAVKLSVTVENKGKTANAGGEIYVRYSFAKPLDNQPNSTLFKTENLPFPSIPPGTKVTLEFSSPHRLPALIDFIREDWLMREYEALFVSKDEEFLIGTLPVTVSAYYYPGHSEEIPAKVPSESKKL